MNLNDVHRGVKKNKPRRRLGRGVGSGQGKTAGRGHKGAGSRAGYSRHPIFQGGVMPLVRRIPKRGFNNPDAIEIAIVNLGELNEIFAAGDEVNPATLKAKHLAKGRFEQIKILGEGELTKKLKISAHRFSQSALDKIQQAGGEAVVIPGPIAVETKKAAVKAEKKAAAEKQGAAKPRRSKKTST